MDLEKTGKAITEVLALQGLLDGAENELSGRQGQIVVDEKEIARLENLKVSTDRAKKDRDALVVKIDGMKKELDKRLVELEKDNVSLPFGKKATKSVSL